jgi:hypothetical protein
MTLSSSYPNFFLQTRTELGGEPRERRIGLVEFARREAERRAAVATKSDG